jgi:hypothetical protein
MNAVTRTRHRLTAGIYDPSIPLADQLATASQQLVGMIEAGELRRLPGCSLVEMRGLAMFLAAASGEARDMAGQIAVRPKRRWWRLGR